MIVADSLDAFDRQSGHRHSLSKLFVIERELHKLTQPVVTDLHLTPQKHLNDE
jgi:hypothetical protein